MEILIVLALGYLFVAPDRFTLAATRGFAGAARGAVNSRTPHSKVAKAPHRAMFAGWREGVGAARLRREAGRDLWSRGTRVSGRVYGGTANLVSGVRGSIQARRDRSSTPELDASPAAVPARRGWAIASLVKRPRTGPTSEGTTEPTKPIEPTKPAGQLGPAPEPTSPEPTTKPAPAAVVDPTPKTPEPVTPAAPVAPTSAPDTPSNPSRIGVIRMPETNVELTNIDALDKYLKALQNVFTDLTEAAERVQKSGKHLQSQWEGADWGTRGLDRAVADICEEIATFKVPKVEAFATGRSEIAKARALGETVETVQARGNTGAFTGS